MIPNSIQRVAEALGEQSLLAEPPHTSKRGEGSKSRAGEYHLHYIFDQIQIIILFTVYIYIQSEAGNAYCVMYHIIESKSNENVDVIRLRVS